MGHVARVARPLVLGLILAALAMLPLARGGNIVWADSLFTLVAAFALFLLPSSKRRLTWHFHGVVVLWLCWLAWQLVQYVPFTTIDAWLGTHFGNEFWDAQGSIPRTRIAVDSSKALTGLVASAGLFCLYLAVALILRRKQSWILVSLGVILSVGVFQAIYGTLAHLTEWNIAWLEPSPPVHQNSAHGTFPNRNHYAAYLVLCFGCGLCLLFGHPQGTVSWNSSMRRLINLLNRPTLLIRAALLSLVVAVVLSRSRMGNAALAVGISVFFVVWILSTRHRRDLGSTLLIFLSVAAIDVMLISNTLGLDQLLERIEQTDLDGEGRDVGRLMAQQMIERYGDLGSGHGSYAVLAHGVRPSAEVGLYPHAHNDYLEFLVEFGYPGLGLLVALLSWHLLLAIRLLQSRSALKRSMGATFLMASAAAGLQASVEFQFHIPAWRALFVSLMAMVMACSCSPSASKRSRPSNRPEVS